MAESIMKRLENILEVTNVSKSFPGVQALNKVNLSIKPGEIRGLVGENGAGKSTLVKAIMGAFPVDEGKITINWKGNSISPRNPIEALRCGLFANYQQLTIAPKLSISENLFLGKMPVNKFGLIDWSRMTKETKRILKNFNLDLDPEIKIEKLSGSQQTMIILSKMAMLNELSIAIFDEPTAFLGIEETEVLFSFIRRLKEKQVSVIYVSHKIDEVLKICDSVTVLKDGEVVDTLPIDKVNEEKLFSLMVGREIGKIYEIEHRKPGEILLEVKNFSSAGKFKNINFDLRRGEILGFFGLIGSGRTEIMRSIFGADKYDSGEIKIKGKPIVITSPWKAMKNGLSLVPENRATQGLAFDLPVKVNVNMSSYHAISKGGFINLKKEKDRAYYYVNTLAIKPPDVERAVKYLSGGNQQKVVLSKALCSEPEIIILDEPTTGVDVGTRREIYKLIEQLTKAGKGIILISSYLPEIIGISDRIIVVSNGMKVGEVKRGAIPEKSLEEELLKMASQIHLGKE